MKKMLKPILTKAQNFNKYNVNLGNLFFTKKKIK